MTSSIHINSFDEVEDQERTFSESPMSYDTMTMEKFLQAEKSVLRASTAAKEVCNMMKVQLQPSLANEKSFTTSTPYPKPENLTGLQSKATELNRRASYHLTAAAPQTIRFEIPCSDDAVPAHNLRRDPSISEPPLPYVAMRKSSHNIFGLSKPSSSLSSCKPIDSQDSVFTFTVKKSDNLLDSMSKRSSMRVEVNTDSRMLFFLPPSGLSSEKEEFSCAAVTAKELSRLGLQLRIQKGQSPVLTRKITFFSVCDRERFMDALEKGKLHSKMFNKHHRNSWKKLNHAKIPLQSALSDSEANGTATRKADHESTVSYEDSLVLSSDRSLHSSLSNSHEHPLLCHDSNDIESLEFLDGEFVVERVQRVTNMVIIAQKERAVQGVMKITNFRVFFMPYDTSLMYGSFDVPLAALHPVQRDGLKLVLPCKDLRKICLSMHDAYAHRSNHDMSPQTPDMRWVQFLMTKMRPPLSIQNVFAFEYKAAKMAATTTASGVVPRKKETNGWLVYSPMQEYQRLGFLNMDEHHHHHHHHHQNHHHHESKNVQTMSWRLLKNSKFRFSPTYPQLMIVPSVITEDQLMQSVRFRSRGRLPIVVWHHPDNKCVLARSSQPNYGLGAKRCEADRLLLKSYRDAANINSSGQPPTLHIVDARKLIATQGNRIKGKGVEQSSHYDNALIEYLGIGNIHKMRESIELLQSLVEPSTGDDGKGFHSLLHDTRWLKHVMKILIGANRVAQILHEEGASVLVHCSDGWDRTPQLCAIAQLILDPHFRTIRGFAELVEKEWCSFGHKFHDRVGVGKDAADMPHERSPVFLQFLDAVWQMTRQFPTGFEFNEKFLLHVVDALFSGLYGTFLYNSEAERCQHQIWEKTESVWTPVLESPSMFTNPLYQRTSRVLYPRANMKRIVLWEALFFRWDPEMHPAYVESLDPLSKMNENGQRRHSFRKNHHNHQNHHPHKRHGGGHANRNNHGVAAMHVEGKTAAYIPGDPSDGSSMSDDNEEEGKGGHNTLHNRRISAKLDAPITEVVHDVSTPQTDEIVGSSVSPRSSRLADAEYSEQAENRARQRNKAHTLREALMMVPDKSRIKYLEQLLSESVARELQLEDQLTGLLLRSRLQAKNSGHTNTPPQVIK